MRLRSKMNGDFRRYGAMPRLLTFLNSKFVFFQIVLQLTNLELLLLLVHFSFEQIVQ